MLGGCSPSHCRVRIIIQCTKQGGEVGLRRSGVNSCERWMVGPQQESRSPEGGGSLTKRHTSIVICTGNLVVGRWWLGNYSSGRWFPSATLFLPVVHTSHQPGAHCTAL